MAIVSLVFGIIMTLAIPFSWTTIGPIRSGFVFAAISLISIFLAKSDKDRPKLATAAMIINLISIILNAAIALLFVTM